MPMDFPDLKSLIEAAKVHGFRQPVAGEEEKDFRNALADHVAHRDYLESEEIRTGKGWDKWSPEKNIADRIKAGIL